MVTLAASGEASWPLLVLATFGGAVASPHLALPARRVRRSQSESASQWPRPSTTLTMGPAASARCAIRGACRGTKSAPNARSPISTAERPIWLDLAHRHVVAAV